MSEKGIARRQFLQAAGLGAASALMGSAAGGCAQNKRTTARSVTTRPNLVYVFADQWRAQAAGYAGDPNVRTPHLDALAARSINFTTAVSGCPVCSPYRASLMTGRYPLTHGVFMNDLRLNKDATSFADAYSRAGYDTAYIGKWHLDGFYRSGFIPKRRRQGFEYWKAEDCTHNYNNSAYHADEPAKRKWDGYDAAAQTQDAQQYIRSHTGKKPFALFLSWGPPHAPYQTAPKEYRDRFSPGSIKLRPNVPAENRDAAQKDLAGYYAHIAALDDCIGELLNTIDQCGLTENTIVVFTSDHGDMLYSQGQRKKQRPYDESIRVPLLLRYPAVLGPKGKTLDMPFNAPDIMPTLLGLSDIEIPHTVEGTDYSGVLKGTRSPCNDAALYTCPAPFGQWTRAMGGRECRGIRTRRYTYVRDLNGPWLLYDNHTDPYQMNNLCGKTRYAGLQNKLEKILQQKLNQTNDEFRSADYYTRLWGYIVDETGTPPYAHSDSVCPVKLIREKC